MTIGQAVAEPISEGPAKKRSVRVLQAAIEDHPDVRRFFHEVASAHPDSDWQRVRQLAATGYILEAERAARKTVQVPPHIFRCLGDSYSNIGWLKPASLAYELSGNKSKIAAAAERWLERGQFEEAQRLLERTQTPFTDQLLGVYFDVCRRNSWHVHAEAEKMRNRNETG